MTELRDIVSKEGIVGVVDISGVPAKNMLDMRNSLRGMITMTMAKKVSSDLHGRKPAFPRMT